MKQIRPCVLDGGPYDGWSGEFLDTGQDAAAFGPDGSKNFVYCRRRRQPKGGPIRFRYSEKLTESALRAAGVPAALRAIAVEPPRPPAAGEAPAHDGPGQLKMAVSVVRHGREWLMKVDGETIAALPVEAISDGEAAKAWVGSVLIPEASP